MADWTVGPPVGCCGSPCWPAESKSLRSCWSPTVHNRDMLFYINRGVELDQHRGLCYRVKFCKATNRQICIKLLSLKGSDCVILLTHWLGHFSKNCGLRNKHQLKANTVSPIYIIWLLYCKVCSFNKQFTLRSRIKMHRAIIVSLLHVIIFGFADEKTWTECWSV